MEKKKVGAIALGTVLAAGVAGTAVYAYKKSAKKREALIDQVYDDYELNHGNSNNYESNTVEDFKDSSVKKHIMKRGK